MRKLNFHLFAFILFALLVAPVLAKSDFHQQLPQINSLKFKKLSSSEIERPASWNQIKHIVVIILENTNASDALKQPFMGSLLKTGAYLNEFYAITHPSQPNYIALLAGTTFGIATDDDITINVNHLGDLLERKRLTWKAYAEDLPAIPCFLGATSGEYVRKHEPFISFYNIQNNANRCDNIVNASQFFTDIKTNHLPSFSIYIPNLLNDGHDTNIAYVDHWLSNTFSSIFKQSNVMKDTLFVITFDEDDWTTPINQIYTLFIGAGVKAGVLSDVHYTHYSLLRTIEEIFQLDLLGTNDRIARVISDIWAA